MTPNAFPALLTAIMEDDCARVEELLKHNPQLATQTLEEARFEPEIAHWIYSGDMALHVAAAGCRVEIAQRLLAVGADPSSVGKHRHSQPLHYACDGHLDRPGWNAERQVAMIHLLLKAGADLHAQDKNGATPLHRAVRTRSAAAVECLLAAGADVNLTNKPGSTPFHLAVQNTGRGGSGEENAKAAQREIIQAFRKRGVSVALRDRNGKSVLDWATSSAVRQALTEAVT